MSIRNWSKETKSGSTCLWPNQCQSIGQRFWSSRNRINLTGFEASGNSSDGLKVVNKCLLVAGPPYSLVPSLEPVFMSVAGEESAVADPKLSATY